ncbi:hypothetical protein IL54_0073 [Sphingobium sp. ba1]|nr:hypothetical protein IL54_0073 [Sphingobium sp. ba1]
MAGSAVGLATIAPKQKRRAIYVSLFATAAGGVAFQCSG